jgi:hypothetical protein
MKIEIYEKKTGHVEETKEVDNLKAFLTYWAMQCDSINFSYRVVEK